MRVQDLLGEGKLARGPEDAADFAETPKEFLIRWCSRGDIDVAGARNRCGSCEASCLCREAEGREVRLLKSVFNAIYRCLMVALGRVQPEVWSAGATNRTRMSLTLQLAACPALSTCDRMLSCLSVALVRCQNQNIGNENMWTKAPPMLRGLGPVSLWRTLSL
jgi:hypothetical protein